MKQIILTAALITLAIQGLLAQHIILSPVMEKTVTGYEYGSVVTYSFKNGFGLGGFYQTTMQSNSESNALRASFYGLQLNVPLKQCEQINFFANTRMGFVTHKFVVIVPGIETEIELFKPLSIGIGMSVRRGFIAANTSIKFKI